MRVLVLGGGGMLGHKMLQVVRLRHPETFATLRAARSEAPYSRTGLFSDERTVDQLDLEDLASLEALLLRLRPDVVLNCAGVIKQRAASQDPIPSITINSLLPHRVARTIGAWDGRLVHFSTDCVFDGALGGYREDARCSAEDLYGQSKYLGEVRGGNALTLRTSIIGRELTHDASLLEWLLKQGGLEIKGYRRHVFTGLSTLQLSESVVDVLENHRDLRGLFHIANPPITKFELLNLLAEAYGVDVRIRPDDAHACDRSLDGRRLDREINRVVPSWREVITQMSADSTPYTTWKAP